MLSQPKRLNPKSADRRDRSKFCVFHGYHGHETEECENLKQQIEALIQSGLLKDFVRRIIAEERQEAEPSNIVCGGLRQIN